MLARTEDQVVSTAQCTYLRVSAAGRIPSRGAPPTSDESNPRGRQTQSGLSSAFAVHRLPSSAVRGPELGARSPGYLRVFIATSVMIVVRQYHRYALL